MVPDESSITAFHKSFRKNLEDELAECVDEESKNAKLRNAGLHVHVLKKQMLEVMGVIGKAMDEDLHLTTSKHGEHRQQKIPFIK